MFDDVGEDLGAVDEDLKDKMVLDNEDGDMYDDGWVIDDDEEPGNVSHKVGRKGEMNQDETGPREMGEYAILRGVHPLLSVHHIHRISQRHESTAGIPTRLDSVPKQEKIPR